MSGTAHIGTSGWHYAHWLGTFYPSDASADGLLPYYGNRLQTVEVNSTFYRLPEPATIRNWLHATPSGFIFACKASRFIIHVKKLKDPVQSLARFVQVLDALGDKLGLVLFQLPPRWPVNTDRLGQVLAVLPKRHRYAFEFRDESWFDDAVYAHLAAHGSAFASGIWRGGNRRSWQPLTSSTSACTARQDRTRAVAARARCGLGAAASPGGARPGWMSTAISTMTSPATPRTTRLR